MSKITIEQLDEVMIKVIKRQLELKSDYSIKQMVTMVLENAKNGNYQGITRSCIPFFQNINIEETLKDIMGCDFKSAVYIYSKRIDTFFKQKVDMKQSDASLNRYDVNYILNAQVFDINHVRELLKGYSINEIIEILSRAYEHNDSFAKIIEQGHDYVIKNDTSNYGTDLNSKIRNFITFIQHYDIYQNDIYQGQINDTKRNLDLFLDTNISLNDKVRLLTDIYYENYNPMLPNLTFDITKQEVIILLLKNLTEVSILSTNMNGLDDNERIVYSGIPVKDVQRTIEFVNNTIDKLVGNNTDKSYLNVDSKLILNNLKNISYEEVNALAGLYVMIRRNKETRRVIEQAPNKTYNLNEYNKTRYVNSSSLYNCLNNKEFMETLSKQTYSK